MSLYSKGLRFFSEVPYSPAINIKKVWHQSHAGYSIYPAPGPRPFYMFPGSQSIVPSRHIVVTFIAFFFSILVLFHEHSRITRLQAKGEGIPLTPHHQFHPLYRHLDISCAITAESSPLHTASSQTRTGNLWFPSASR